MEERGGSDTATSSTSPIAATTGRIPTRGRRCSNTMNTPAATVATTTVTALNTECRDDTSTSRRAMVVTTRATIDAVGRSPRLVPTGSEAVPAVPEAAVDRGGKAAVTKLGRYCTTSPGPGRREGCAGEARRWRALLERRFCQVGGHLDAGSAGLGLSSDRDGQDRGHRDREEPPGVQGPVGEERGRSPSATTTASAAVQSSPTRKSYQNCPNRRIRPMSGPGFHRGGQRCRLASQERDQPERHGGEERDEAEDGEVLAGPRHARALTRPRRSRRWSA